MTSALPYGMRDKYWTVLRRCLKFLTQVTEGVTRWGRACFFLSCRCLPLCGPLWLSSRCPVGVTRSKGVVPQAVTAVRPRKGSRKAAQNRRDATRKLSIGADRVSCSELHLMRLRLTSVGKFESILGVRFEGVVSPSLVFRAVGQVSRSLFVAILPACEKRAKT